MGYIIVKVALRALAVILMSFGFFFTSESENLVSTDHFIMIGVHGSYTLVSMGLLLEAGLYLKSEKFIQLCCLLLGLTLNLVCSVLAFAEYYNSNWHKQQAINKGVMSALTATVCLVDSILLFT